MKNLKIYFTSDIHGFIYPTDYIDKEEKNIGLLNLINQLDKDGNTLIIDGGDTIQGSPFTNYLRSNDFEVNPIASIMNASGYDYVTLGNHDFNYGYDYLKKYINNLNAKCLCANVKDATGEIDILPYDIKTLNNGLKIGLIGLTTDFINRWERPEHIENLTISDTFETLKLYYDRVKSNCDILVGIYHGGFEYDLESHEQLSKTTENIAYKICESFDFDILLTGHQHLPIDGQFLSGTYIAQTPPNATKFLELNLKLNDDNTKIINSSLIDVELNPNKQMYNEYLDIQNKVKTWLDTPVGFLDIELQPTSHLDMALNGSNLANFINQVELAESGADIACTSFSNVIKGFDKNVTVKDIMSTYLFPNTLVVLEVTRKDLELALERCASYFDNSKGQISISDLFLKPKVEHYNYDYFANLHYTFDINKDIGNRVTSIIFNGKELTQDDKLTLVLNNYRAAGAGGYEFYTDCKVVKEILVEMPEAIINYFINNQHVTVDKSKYITVIH